MTEAWRGMAIPGAACRGRASHGVARQGGRMVYAGVRLLGAHAWLGKPRTGWPGSGQARLGRELSGVDNDVLGLAGRGRSGLRLGEARTLWCGQTSMAGQGTTVLGPAWLGWVRQCVARPCKAWGLGGWQAPGFEPPAPTYGCAGPGLARTGKASHGWARHGRGVAGRCWAGCGSARQGPARQCKARSGPARQGIHSPLRSEHV